MPAIALLAETLGHPAYVGVKGARELINTLNKRFNFKINIKNLDKEINEIEEGIKTKTKQLGKLKKGKSEKITYIG